jgi:GT2 family glycosyltransferase/glycosyltransferase involved in cell wall biosynthesis
LPPGEQGGTELYAEALARALRDRGDVVTVLARAADPARPELAAWREDREGIAVVRLNHTFRHARGFADTYRAPAVRAAAAAQIAAAAPEVAHVHHLTCLSADLLEELTWQRVPTVFTLHDFWPICHRGQLLDRQLQRCAGPGGADGPGCPGCLGAEAAPAGERAGRLLRKLAATLPGGASYAALGELARRAAASAPAAPFAAASRAATRERAAFLRRQLGYPQALLAPSRTLRERFVDFGIPAERLIPQRLGIDLAPFRGLVPAARQGPLRLGFVGSLMVSKGADVLLAAFAQLPAASATLRVLGGHADYHGDASYRARLEPLLRLPGVVWDGPVPHAAVPAALAELDVLVVPSVWLENSPLTVREAFAAGVPVVASDLGGLAEAVRHDVDGLLFAPGDVTALAACLRRLADERGLLTRLRAGISPVRDIAEDAAWTREVYRRAIHVGVGKWLTTADDPERDRTVTWPQGTARAGVDRAAGDLPTESGGVGLVDRHPEAPAADRPAATAAPATKAPRLAAVVLNYRTPDDTLLAVRSLEASRRHVAEVVVVDNGSGDGSPTRLRAHLPGTTLLATGRNLGFSAGCNVGIRHALGAGADRVLLLNSDAVLVPDALGHLEAALAATGAGIAAPLVLARSAPERVVSAGIRWSPGNARMRHLGYGEPATSFGAAVVEVDAAAGCALLIERRVLAAVGLLAEEFFFSFEDVELCLRARDAGFATVCAHAARALHEGGRSLDGRSPARLYYGTRNHLLLAARRAGRDGGLRRARRFALVLGYGLAHAALRSGVARPAALAAVLRGAGDHLRGRYGPAPGTPASDEAEA